MTQQGELFLPPKRQSPDVKVKDYSNHVPEVLPPTKEQLKIEVHREHAFEVLDTLMDAYAQNAYPYNLDSTRLPHDPRHMPETLQLGSVDHAMFLFNVCYYMRGGIKSNDAVRRMSRVYNAHPELFDCEFAQGVDPDELAGVLTEHGLGFQKTVSRQWVENSRRMVERAQGDPRKLFENVDDYEQSLKVVKNDGKGNGFLGFQEKMTSMIVYYLMDEELIEPFQFPIPVDLHVMRVSIANEMITFGDAPYGTDVFKKETLETLRELYYDYAQNRGVSALRLCDAVWMLSQSLCGQHPGNTTLEPLGRHNRNGRSTVLIPGEVLTQDKAQRAAYERSCGRCAIEKTCQYNIPGTPYYVGGNLIIRGPRERFPVEAERQSTLFE